MKLKIFLIICTVMALPSTSTSKRVDKNGHYVPYYGYTIIARTGLPKTSIQIQQFLAKSSFKNRYAALPAETYHMSIYTIYSIGNPLIPPVKKWKDDTGLQIPKRSWLPEEVLEEHNNKAVCILEKYITEPLRIKYATLSVGKTIIKLKLILDDKSVTLINNARKELKKVYKHPNKSLEPIHKTVHITLAYAYRKSQIDNVDDWNRLNYLVREFNGANFSLPTVYLFQSMSKYKLFNKKDYFSCTEFFRE